MSVQRDSSSASWGTHIQKKTPKTKKKQTTTKKNPQTGGKSMITNPYIHTYMYVIMLSHGETKWIGYSLDVLKLGFM